MYGYIFAKGNFQNCSQPQARANRAVGHQPMDKRLNVSSKRTLPPNFCIIRAGASSKWQEKDESQLILSALAPERGGISSYQSLRSIFMLR